VRIAIVTETFLPQVNGTLCMLLEILTYLQARRHEAIVFGPGDGERACQGVAIARVHGAPLPLYPELILAPYRILGGPTLRAWRPDIVHLAGPFVLGPHGLSVARALGVPVVAHYQTDIARCAEHFGLGALAGLARRRLLDLHNDCDATFAPTPSVARELRERGMLRVHVCGRGVDTRLFHPTRRDPRLRVRLTGARDRPLLLYVGRLSPEKNLAALIAVARALPDYPLLIVGDGPARGILAAELVGRNVYIAGLLQGQDLAAAYASADMFLFPSATETFGQVVREAMASGLPVIGVRAGGVQDLIRDGETGLLCAPGDEAALIAAVEHLAEDATLRRTMGAAARQEAERHTWDAVFDHLMDWYGCLANRRHVPPAVIGEEAAQ
jgi:glycosyltransferase involved in cell wall biosynthesis